VDDDECLRLRAIGAVRSELRDPADAPRQGDEGAPHAQLVLAPDVVPGLDGLQVGDELLVLTWLHLARRDVLHTRPRNDPARPEQGVFTTRSPDRPNPIGLHRVRVLALRSDVIEVDGLEAVDGTPVLDLKPVLGGVEER
jgi:tRNA-Thr(GGU) m(6)t(6)A37 methyltransferase TsaA